MKKKTISKKSHAAMPGLKGILDISRSGLGYVMVEGRANDIIVKKENLKNAMDGDTVEVYIIKQNPNAKRAEGIIAKVLQRGQNELVGTVQMNLNFAFVISDQKSFHKDIFINEKNSQGLQDGDRVIVRITDWKDGSKNPEGIVLEKLNNLRNNEIAMKEILLQYGFQLIFPKEVDDELAALSTEITEEDVQSRRDMRGIFTLTIDPYDAKDFDDAISIQSLPNGHLEVGVHIADVSHYVKAGSALDQEAYRRATSVYLPDRVLPMLPEKISNELCSLRPNEDKLTFSVIFEIDANANVKSHWIGRTIIHSDIRLTYEEAQERIEGLETTYSKEVVQLHQLSQQIRQRRFKDGAINFSSEEVRFKLDEQGVPIDVMVKESKECHQLIEEWMLLANRTIAAFVHEKKVNQQAVPFPYRIHDSPDMEKLKPFVTFAARFGYKFNVSSPQHIAASFNQMVTTSALHPEHSILHTLGIRTMAKAVYSTDNIGHYGLAFAYYCHFTSPIRRYPDVLVHRILQECLDNRIQPIKNMEEQCLHCSERERKAMEAEREGTKYKQVEWMRKFIGEEFEAVISGVAAFGMWAQTTAHKCEGFISMTDLMEFDDFEFSEEEYALIGRRSKLRFQMGKTIHVKVVAANLEKRQIDFALVMDGIAQQAPPKIKKTKKLKF
ncbi:MAG TPA: ribonuclease R [Chitinophagaceae bacterium]|nr:ribonuclease R [Chitinophagaceae bacterium]